ncbi:tyrosine-type recombinase/integrase [Falsiroseomonas sp. E2-1-a4]|uniref:tyrosine-type recombinase/integrase n=1 Tax=Falsiroseomonas sp. E2-1-a4 TaxID=3239299 RepID=UPI003F3C9415
MAEIRPLRRRMIEDMTVRNLSPATQRSYLYAVGKFSRHFGCSPELLDLDDVRAFQVHLVSQGIAWSSLNQTVAALRFFFGVTLGNQDIPERIAYAREPRRLPVVLGADEVVRFLEAVPGLRNRTALTTAYAAGLRVSEVVSLGITDIDSSRMVIRVQQGKGRKDRGLSRISCAAGHDGRKGTPSWPDGKPHRYRTKSLTSCCPVRRRAPPSTRAVCWIS